MSNTTLFIKRHGRGHWSACYRGCHCHIIGDWKAPFQAIKGAIKGSKEFTTIWKHYGG